MLRRFAVLLMFALWMGGFTFYTLIVIPTGGKVLDGGERDVGFITQQVTIWLNWIGVAALPVFFDWHRRYMAVASLQWLAALGYMWMTLLIWRATDKQNSQCPVSAPATA